MNIEREIEKIEKKIAKLQEKSLKYGLSGKPDKANAAEEKILDLIDERDVLAALLDAGRRPPVVEPAPAPAPEPEPVDEYIDELDMTHSAAVAYYKTLRWRPLPFGLYGAADQSGSLPRDPQVPDLPLGWQDYLRTWLYGPITPTAYRLLRRDWAVPR